MLLINVMYTMKSMRSFVAAVIPLVNICVLTACSPLSFVENDNSYFKSVVIDSLPGLEAIELPMHVSMASQRLLDEVRAVERIKVVEEIVVAFESNNPIGLLNVENNDKSLTARQFEAYCTSDGVMILVYNFVFLNNEDCRRYPSLWRRQIVMDSSCTSLGVFRSTIECDQ
jgi:hypothetical protein